MAFYHQRGYRYRFPFHLPLPPYSHPPTVSLPPTSSHLSLTPPPCPCPRPPPRHATPLLQLSTIDEEEGLQLGKNEIRSSYSMGPSSDGTIVQSSSQEGEAAEAAAGAGAEAEKQQLPHLEVQQQQQSRRPFKTLPHTQSMGSETSSVVSDKVSEGVGGV